MRNKPQPYRLCHRKYRRLMRHLWRDGGLLQLPGPEWNLSILVQRLPVGKE